MKTALTDIYKYSREICRSTARINLLSIALITLIVYFVYLIIFNQDFLFFLTNIKGLEDYNSTDDYMLSLEALHINEMSLLIPIGVVIILFIAPSEYIKRDLQNRLLPVSTGVRVVTIILVSLYIALVSSTVVVLLDHALIAYMRFRFLDEISAFRESTGDLYHQLPNNAILSSSYSYFIPFSKWLSMCLLIPFINVLILNMAMLFARYSIIKGVLFLGIIIFIVITLYNSQQPIPSTVIAVDVPWITNLYSWVIMACLLLTLFFVFKEREG